MTVKTIVDFVRELAREWRDDRASGLAAEMAFFGILSLFPTLLTLVASLGYLDALAGGDVADRAEREVVGFLRRVLTDNADDTIAAVQSLFDETSPGLITLGGILAVWSASRGFVALVRALNLTYDIDERRSYVRVRAIALGLAVGTILLLAVTLTVLVVGPLLGTGHDVADEIGLGDAFAKFWDWTRWPAALVLMVLWAATIFHLAPNRRTAWKNDLPGAVVTAAAWGLLSLGFRTYLTFASETNQVLGTLGGALIVLVWLYLLSIGVLLGGEVNAIAAGRRRTG